MTWIIQSLYLTLRAFLCEWEELWNCRDSTSITFYNSKEYIGGYTFGLVPSVNDDKYIPRQYFKEFEKRRKEAKSNMCFLFTAVGASLTCFLTLYSICPKVGSITHCLQFNKTRESKKNTRQNDLKDMYLQCL